jgi:hypothetical protein
MLKGLGLTPDTAQLSPTRWKGGGEYSLGVFDRLWNDWRLIDGTAIGLGRRCLKAAPSCESLGREGAAELGFLEDHRERTAPAPTGDLAAEIATLDPSAATPELRGQTTRLPSAVKRAAATILQGAMAAKADLDSVYAKLGGLAKVKAIATEVASFGTAYDLGPDMLAAMRSFDEARMLSGYLKLALAVDRATDLIRHAPKTAFHFRCDTAFGRIELNGNQSCTYDDVPYLLIFDEGSGRHFPGGASAAPANPVSVMITTGGTNVFQASARAFGCGVLGYGILVDLGGRNEFNVGTAGLGAGIFGVGALLAEKGGNRFAVRSYGEGAGTFGLGLLSDLQGGDRFDCFIEAQGFGQCRGLGALVDVEGRNTYVANDEKIDYPSPQTAQHNTSLAQGCGFGRREDGGHSMAGGIGLLVDGAGNDTYRCGVFGQGVAYWYALGYLVNFGSDNRYEGQWYVQGAAAHYAVGALCALGGRGIYKASIAQNQGHGRDYSIGWLHVKGGDDALECPGTAQGSSNMNGIGVLWHEGGRATFSSGAQSMGFAGDSRPGELCLGLFRADGALNVYKPSSPGKARSTWIQAGSDKGNCKGSGRSR